MGAIDDLPLIYLLRTRLVMRVEQALKHGFIQPGIMHIAFQFMPTSANCYAGGWRTVNFRPNMRPKTVAQSKLKDFQEGEMRLGKACGLRKGNLETKRVGPNQNVLPSISISTTGQRVMKANLLDGKKVAILVTDGFEYSELEEPRAALDDAKAATFVISPINNAVKAWNKVEFGDTVKVDVLLRYADSDDYDALLLPGGVMNPDRLRQLPEAVEFVRAFFERGKPVAAICHGPQILIDADVVRGRRLTSYPSIKVDLINAGARWVDEKVVVDRGLVTSRRPDDIPDFNKKMIEKFAEGVHAVQVA